MKKKLCLSICRFNTEFLRYTEMIEFIDYLFSNNHDELIENLKSSLVDFRGIKHNLKECLNECNRQLNFIENFLDDCGVNIYEKC